MAESFQIPETEDRATRYESLIPQIESLVHGEKNFIANVSNCVAAIQQMFHFHWVGCYFVEHNELVLGPFQGPVACTRIALGRGVCGTAWKSQKTIIVQDVELFPGHIACSSLSKSEIVIPIKNTSNQMIGVLDLDSDKLNDFHESDQIYLEKIANIIGTLV